MSGADEPGPDASAEQAEAVSGAPVDRDELGAELDITLRVVLSAFVGGAVGLVAMVPILFVPPFFFDLFRAEALVDVAELGRVLGLEPNLLLGVLVFVAGGTIALPLLFVVAGAFLPPRQPRAARGITFATIMWTGFVLAFWPGEYAGVLFLGLSLAAHWVYGYVLGSVMQRLAYVPQHSV
ncbi:hypothetical protein CHINAEXTREME_18050 [Halobiforma lacisalsi AJ5]|uniref:Cytochrome C oxidase subunit I n=1 Tax=Natronobacterium lacisalsi AJ5 TaxID=358396 RepID=M0LDN0_NATLA|nr:DUF6789 family protein [Halobiforma lacisalsi]APW99556.1 hypothetical protein CHINAEXTREME_18050 [Halobiforma lacisalsi AJ5]EMA31682.1 hypothetical protein C445_14407 [Halobiforma lacisalsi AJ5]